MKSGERALNRGVWLRQFVFIIGTAGVAAGQTRDADSAGQGALVLQSPVQAVASINGRGAFLVVPGQDLSWNRIPPGTYNILISVGPQRWQRDVQIKAGETATLVAVLTSPGPPLSTGTLPTFSTDTPITQRNSIPPTPVPPPPATDTAATPDKAEQYNQQEMRIKQQALERAQREDREAQRRLQDAGVRARGEAAAREEEKRKQEEKGNKPRRPKVH